MKTFTEYHFGKFPYIIQGWGKVGLELDVKHRVNKTIVITVTCISFSIQTEAYFCPPCIPQKRPGNSCQPQLKTDSLPVGKGFLLNRA